MPPPRKGREAAFAMTRVNHDFQKFSGGPTQGSVTQPELPPFVKSPVRFEERTGHGSSQSSTDVVPFVEEIWDTTGKRIMFNHGFAQGARDGRKCSLFVRTVIDEKVVRTGK